MIKISQKGGLTDRYKLKQQQRQQQNNSKTNNRSNNRNREYNHTVNNRNDYNHNKFKPTIIPQQAINSQTINLASETEKPPQIDTKQNPTTTVNQSSNENINSNKRIKGSAIFNKTLVENLYDSGEDETIITENVFRKIQMEDEETNLEVYTGSKIKSFTSETQILGQMALKSCYFNQMDQLENVKVIVTGNQNSNNACIVGTDLMKRIPEFNDSLQKKEEMINKISKQVIERYEKIQIGEQNDKQERDISNKKSENELMRIHFEERLQIVYEKLLKEIKLNFIKVNLKVDAILQSSTEVEINTLEITNANAPKHIGKKNQLTIVSETQESLITRTIGTQTDIQETYEEIYNKSVETTKKIMKIQKNSNYKSTAQAVIQNSSNNNVSTYKTARVHGTINYNFNRDELKICFSCSPYQI